jgi:hypothetical protein
MARSIAPRAGVDRLEHFAQWLGGIRVLHQPLADQERVETGPAKAS